MGSFRTVGRVRSYNLGRPLRNLGVKPFFCPAVLRMIRSFSLVWALALLALARYLWLACYVHPYADDLSYAFVGMRTDLLDRLLQEYRFWNGRYFSNLLVLRGPITLGWEQGLLLYRIVPVLLLLGTWWSAYRFIHAFVGDDLERPAAALSSLIFTLLFLNAMPDLSEGIYWYTGAVTYQLANALTLLLAAAWCRHVRSGWRSPAWRMAGMVVLTILICGSNELHMAWVVLGHAGLLVWQRVTTGRWNGWVVSLLVLSLACLVMIALAPGNAVRGAHFPQKQQFWHTLFTSLVQTGRFVGTWLFTTLLLPVSVVFLLWFRRWGHIPAWCRMDRWVALAIPFGTVFVGMVLPYWSTGILGQYRTVNASLFLFLPAWFVALAVWDVQVFRARWSIQLVIPRLTTITLLVCALFFVWGNDRHVTTDLLSGRAARWETAMASRYQQVRGAVQRGDRSLELPPLDPMPRSLTIVQPGPDPASWLNRSLAQYFGNEDLRISVRSASR